MDDSVTESSMGLGLKRVIAIIWAALAIGLIGCMGLGRLGDSAWVFDLLNHFYVQYAAIGLFGALIALALRFRVAAVLFLMAFGIAGFQLVPLFRAPAIVAPTDATDLRVLSLNVLTSNSEQESTTDWVLSESADILVLMETGAAWTEEFDSILRDYDRLETDTIREDNFGLSVYVRPSTVDVAGFRVLITDHGIPWIDAQILKDGRPFHLVAIHTLPPVGQQAARRRGAHLDNLSAHVQTIEGPVVVAGDLNATIWSGDLVRVLEQQHLRPTCLGFGPMGSWPARLWFTGMVLIDHVLVTPNVAVTNHRVGLDIGSDHRGIVVDLRL